MVSVYNQGSVTVTLASAQQDGYSWRLAEIPDPTVLKLVSQDFIPPASGVGRGEEKWVFQAVGPGDVDVKMWYGNLREAPVTGNPNFNFIASVSNGSGPVKKVRSEIKTKKEKKPEHTVARAF
jgi:predicted secreted protein